jgi:hypothetical protein
MPGTPPPTAPTPLDDGDFDRIERQRLRQILVDQDRTSWAIRQLKIFVPMLTAFVVAGYQVWDWVATHIKFSK